jgi:hypothetical protein
MLSEKRAFLFYFLLIFSAEATYFFFMVLYAFIKPLVEES